MRLPLITGLFTELEKTAEAELRTELLPHQQRVVERMREAPGLVVAHGLGTGKTLSSIAVAADQGGKVVALVPASLQDQPRAVRDQIVRDYNAGKLRALLVSSAGGEGLDLKNTRQVQVLEPHWNEEKLKQVIGRAVRHRSHSALPPDQRTVDVEKYETYPTGIFGQRELAVEPWLYRMSAEKDRLNQEVLDLLREKSR